MKNIAILLAAGTGSRIKSDIPKQFILLEGMPILEHSLKTFSQCEMIDEIVLVINENYKEMYLKIATSYAEFKKIHFVVGGKTRQDSVRNAIDFVSKNEDNAIILVHDSARPFVSERIILDNIQAVKKSNCCTTAIRSSNSVYVTEEGKFVNEVDRDTIYIAQTPQSGYLEIFKKAFATVDKIYTDEAALFSALGYVPHIVTGEEKNRKITFPEDLK